MLVLVSLLGYAVIVAFASPLLLSRGTWRIRFPRLALHLWLLFFISGLLALLGSLSWSIGLAVDGSRAHPAAGAWFGATAIAIFAWLGLGILGGVVALVMSRFEPMDAAKRRANQQLTLLEATSSYRATDVSGIRVNFVDCAAPLAMSFAGEDKHIVVTSKLEDELTPAQLRSVIEHERGPFDPSPRAGREPQPVEPRLPAEVPRRPEVRTIRAPAHRTHRGRLRGACVRGRGLRKRPRTSGEVARQ
ncbi:MAG: hypothetical protein WDM88_09440 [Galbitalea sp.]